jgi:hypothetical protein
VKEIRSVGRRRMNVEEESGIEFGLEMKGLLFVIV